MNTTLLKLSAIKAINEENQTMFQYISTLSAQGQRSLHSITLHTDLHTQTFHVPDEICQEVVAMLKAYCTARSRQLIEQAERLIK